MTRYCWHGLTVCRKLGNQFLSPEAAQLIRCQWGSGWGEFSLDWFDRDPKSVVHLVRGIFIIIKSDSNRLLEIDCARQWPSSGSAMIVEQGGWQTFC